MLEPLGQIALVTAERERRTVLPTTAVTSCRRTGRAVDQALAGMGRQTTAYPAGACGPQSGGRDAFHQPVCLHKTQSVFWLSNSPGCVTSPAPVFFGLTFHRWRVRIF